MGGTMPDNWHKAYAELRDDIAKHPSIEIGVNVVSVPSDVRPEFYRIFDALRMSFIRQNFQSSLEESYTLATEWERLKQSAKESLQFESVDVRAALNWFLLDPVSGLMRVLFDPLFDLLKGKIDLDTFKSTAAAAVDEALKQFLSEGYKRWTTLALVFTLTTLTGLTMGLAAAAVQAYFQVAPPVAYGICLLGHPRDFLNYLANHFAHTHWPVISTFAIYPTLLVLGILGGSFIAASRNHELAFRPGPVRNRFYAFMFGFLVVNFGLLWGSCPIRTALLVAYGNMTALIVILSISTGAILACIYVKWRVIKERR